MSFVDDVNAATAADHLIVAMAQLQRLKGVLDLHIDNLFERRMSQNASRVYKCATGLPYWPKLPEKMAEAAGKKAFMGLPAHLVNRRISQISFERPI